MQYPAEIYVPPRDLIRVTTRADLDRLEQVFSGDLCGIDYLVQAGDVKEQVPGSALGWQDLSATPVEIHVIPGNHYTMLAKPNVQVLADELRNCLDRGRL